jgi:hypothetical protein
MDYRPGLRRDRRGLNLGGATPIDRPAPRDEAKRLGSFLVGLARGGSYAGTVFPLQ